MIEFYHVAARKFARQIPAAYLAQLMHELSEWDPLVVTPDLINEAILIHRTHGVSWWDSTIVAAALHAEADVLYSEDLQHGREIDGLRIQNPFVSRVSEPERAYRSRKKR
jgi:predicted nucleic acid-binding protein